MDTWLIVLIVVVSVLVLVGLIILIWRINCGNSLRRLVIKVEEGSSGIDVALTKRYDLLIKEIAVVKGYAKHESETLEKIISMRQPSKGASMAEKSAYAGEISKAFDSVNVVMEQYPDLKASANFANLQHEVFDVEEQLQAARRVYNSNVRELNDKVVSWPSSIVARHIGVTKKDFFEAEASKREDVKIEF